MSWQLVVHPDEEVRSTVGRHLRRALRGNARPADAGTVDRARWYVQDSGLDDCSLVVIGSATPQDAGASVGMSGRGPAKQLIKELKDERARLPIIVLSSAPDEGLVGFLDAFDRVALVTIDTAFGENLLARIASLRADEERNDAACLELDIELSDRQAGRWHLRRSGGSVKLDDWGILQLDADRLEQLLYRSTQLGGEVEQRSAGWLASLRYLSDDLRTLLFAGGTHNAGLWEKFETHRKHVGGIANTRIRITVNDETHPLLVEALKDREAPNEDYWVLSAPVFRRYARETPNPPLFKDDRSRVGRINCLIIEADGAAGVMADERGGSRSFSPLGHCADECAQIHKILKSSDSFDELRVLRVADCGPEASAQVLRTLGEQQWHIVHFCGHLASGPNDEPGLVLYADDGGMLPVAGLVGALENTQLLFLSSCRSASAKVVLHAIEKHVPAVLGFQWVIEDSHASEFTRAFYQMLFDREQSCYRYLEYAFMKARKASFDAHPDKPSWMAPLLVMQRD